MQNCGMRLPHGKTVRHLSVMRESAAIISPFPSVHCPIFDSGFLCSHKIKFKTSPQIWYWMFELNVLIRKREY